MSALTRAAPEAEYGSILVPLFGTSLDEDIVQTAALLVSGEPTDEAAIDEATIEAVWVFVIPMSLPLDARLPEAQIKEAWSIALNRPQFPQHSGLPASKESASRCAPAPRNAGRRVASDSDTYGNRPVQGS